MPAERAAEAAAAPLTRATPRRAGNAMLAACCMLLAGAQPAATGSTAAPAIADSDAASPLEPLAWLAGCWDGTLSSGANYQEWWMPEAGGMMLGLSRMFRGDRMITFEFMVLRVEDGNPVLLAQPASNAAPVRFPLARRDEDSFIFENTAHDFPHRVIYTDPSTGGTFARIEGPGRDGGVRALAFPLQRSACSGGGADR